MNTARAAATVLLVLTAALLLAACGPQALGRESQAMDAGAGRSSSVSSWSRAAAPTDVSLLEVPAEVLPSPGSTGAVVAPFAARIVRVFVRPGQTVARGQAVAAVVMPQLIEAAGHHQAALTRLAAYRARRAQLEKLRVDGLARTAEIAEVETRIAEAQADEQAAAATLRAGGATGESAKAILGRGGVTTLASPVAGIVVEVDAAIGESRDATGRPLARIVGEGDPRIQARTAHRLPPGARFTFASASGARTPVRLLSQSPLVDGRDGSRLSWFEPLPAPRGAGSPGLAQGASGRLQITLDETADVVAVPASAVSLDGGKAWLTLRDAARAGTRRVEVEVLATSGADALVRGLAEPLAPGTEVATDGRAASPAAASLP